MSSEPKSAKMLIFLQNGEERLITFTLPRERCTLQEILEKVNVPFSEDTHIQCMQKCSSKIDYFVSVGLTTKIEDMLENHPLLVGNMSTPEKAPRRPVNLPDRKVLNITGKDKKDKPKKSTPNKMDNPDNVVNDVNKSNTIIRTEKIQVINESITENLIPADKIKTETIDNEVGEDPPLPQFASPELTGFPDVSQFCESVMKISKETQTPPQEAEDPLRRTKKRKMDPAETNEYFLQSCAKNLPKGMLQLIKWQMNSKQNVDNYKFHMFALNLYFSGASSYNCLKGMMGLPDMDAIKKLFIPKNTKFDNSLINALKIKVGHMSPRERICSISIGSMQLRPNLYYNIKADKIEGLHEIDGVQKMEPAKYALVFMVQGILEKWTQPVAHSLISRHENSPEISIWVEEIITLLIDIGLDVRAFVSDPKTEMLYMSESQRVTPAKPYFYINDKIIYCIYDTIHLHNSVKGYLEDCNFFLAGDSSGLGDNAEFTIKFNNLISILNSKTCGSLSPFKRAYSDEKSQSTFLKDMLSMFSTLKVVRRADGLEMKNLEFINCIQISIISITNLFKDLKKGGAKGFLTCRVSQYFLNKFFAKARKGKKGCSSRQLRSCFARCFVYNMLKKPIGDFRGKNAELKAEFSAQSMLSVGKSANQMIKVETTDYRLALPKKKTINTVCRYLYLKCIDHHSCDKFKEYLSQSPESRLYVAPYRSSAPLDIRNCKLTPPKNFTSFIMTLEKRFKDYCKQDAKISSIGHQVLKKIASLAFEMPCKCFPLDYLKRLFVRLRIFYTVRENNIVFKKDNNKSFNTFKL